MRILVMKIAFIAVLLAVSANVFGASPFAMNADSARDARAEIFDPPPLLLNVTTTDDSGPGSLRAALADANTRCVAGVSCQVDFVLPAGSTFEPLTPLPAITACGSLSINGGSVDRREGDRPFELSGARLTTGRGNGLEYRPSCVQPSNFRVTGLAVNRFPDDGITVLPFHTEFASNPNALSFVSLEGVFIGTDRTGRQARPNGWRGITVHSPTVALSVRASVLSGNGRSGIYISHVTRADVRDNLIGLAADGQPLGNGAAGIFLHHGALHADNNVIAYNSDFGLALARGASAALHGGNSIHSNEFVGIDWGLDGPTRASGEQAGIPNAPRISSATYDPIANTTTVRGTLQVERLIGRSYFIDLYSSRTANARGEWEGETPYPAVRVGVHPQGQTGTYDWEIQQAGDLRGLVVTTTASAQPETTEIVTVTSEFSDAISVR
jgi:Periplasmic copper-binding protein (NosD)